MGTWQPPIPAGAFWTEDALKIGPALSLLGYCYDKVDRHGHVALNLHEAASDMGIQYPTIKRWWNLLKHTNYIAKYHERGRAGMDVWMSINWLDWRYAIGTETGSKMSPINGTGYINGIKNDPENQATGQKRDRNGIKNDPDTPMYKVLISTDQAESHGGSEDQDRTRRTHPPAVAILFDIFPEAAISEAQSDDLCAIDNLALWREVLTTWKTNGYRPRLGNLLDRYTKELAFVTPAKGYKNGNRPVRQDTGQDPERAQWRTELADEL